MLSILYFQLSWDRDVCAASGPQYSQHTAAALSAAVWPLVGYFDYCSLALCIIPQSAGRGPHAGGVRVAVRALVSRRATVRHRAQRVQRSSRLHQALDAL